MHLGGPPQILISLAAEIAAAHTLDPALVCAVIEQESGWNPWVMRYEPAFFAKYVAPLYTNNQISASEAYARGFSWGLMQVMGQVALDGPEWASRLVLFRVFYLGLAPYERVRPFLGLSEMGWTNWTEEIRRRCGKELLRRGLFPPRKYFQE